MMKTNEQTSLKKNTKRKFLNLEISVDEIVDLEVFVVIAPRIEKGLCNLNPTHVPDELEDGEDRNVDVRRVVLERVGRGEGDVEGREDVLVHVVVRRQEKLVGKQGREQVRVD